MTGMNVASMIIPFLGNFVINPNNDQMTYIVRFGEDTEKYFEKIISDNYI